MAAQDFKGERRSSTPPAGKYPSYPPMGAGGNGISVTEDRVRNLLKEGKREEVVAFGQSARYALFKLLNNPKESQIIRVSAAEIISGWSESVRATDRILSLILTNRLDLIASMDQSAVFSLISIVKNKEESLVLRIMAVEAAASMAEAMGMPADISIVSGLSSVLANDSEHYYLRTNIAFELVRVARICKGAKLQIIRTALEKARYSKEATLASSAEDALAEINENSGACVDDDNPTLRLPKKR